MTRMGPTPGPASRVVRTGTAVLDRARAVFRSVADGRKSAVFLARVPARNPASYRDVIDAACGLLIERHAGRLLTTGEVEHIVRLNVANNLSGLLKGFLEEALEKPVHVEVQIQGDDVRAAVEVDGKQAPTPVMVRPINHQVN